MKVRELKFLLSKELHKLRDVSEMDVADYLKFIDEKKKKGIKINKPYQELYDNIKANWASIQAIPVKPPVQQPAIDPVIQSLEPIPIDELKIHSSDSNVVDRLKSGGIVNLGQLYETPIDKIGRLPNIGSTTLSKIISMKDAVAQNPNEYMVVLTHCSKEVEGEIVIPEGVTEIGHEAFYECTDINTVVIPNSVVSIGSNAFSLRLQ